MDQSTLGKYDIVLAVDKSGSMAEPAKGTSGISRWQAAKEAAVSLATEAAKYDDDGITVTVFANNMKEYANINDGPTKAAAIFTENSPNGGTDTAKVINFYADAYLASRTKGEAKPVILVIITDGIPNDESEVVKAIVRLTKQLKVREEFGIQFIQVGDDQHARDFLKRLDDNLTKEGATLDIVDTKTFDELESISLSEALMDALTD
jgi:Mg-chelatase subunit ChlD